MIILVIVGCVIAALGVLLAAAGIAVACMQDKGRRCAYRRPSAAVILARDVWDSLRSGTAFLPPAPMQAIVPDAGVLARASWETIRAGMGATARRPVNGVYRGTQPRLGRAPFTQLDMPAHREPEPAGLPRLGPACLLPAGRIPPQIAAHFDEQAAQGRYPCCEHCEGFTCDDPDHHLYPCDIDGCQSGADEAERQFALATVPDGCEAVS